MVVNDKNEEKNETDGQYGGDMAVGYNNECALFLTAVGSESFRAPYEAACGSIRAKLEQINDELSRRMGRKFIKSIDSRVKSPQSCLDKMIDKNYEINRQTARERLNDIAGVRAVCFFLDDVYKLADILLGMPEYEFVKLKDYVKKPKASGYQSLHLILKVPFVRLAGQEPDSVKVEIQIRTQAMDFWSDIEHHFIYKEVNGDDLSEVEEEFLKCAKSVRKIDKQMLKIRKKILRARMIKIRQAGS
ncbi:MAG: GTP pyrophosphokinase family protein [Roseburia sp.]|nr:GTP pyrophosphokinase family protein [Roseburia sp.]